MFQYGILSHSQVIERRLFPPYRVNFEPRISYGLVRAIANLCAPTG
ncbi:hypothetical protein [Thermosynechococcus sp. NK55a]